MFKKLTAKDQLRIERERNLLLLNKQTDLENAIFELAETISEGAEVKSEGVEVNNG